MGYWWCAECTFKYFAGRSLAKVVSVIMMLVLYGCRVLIHLNRATILAGAVVAEHAARENPRGASLKKPSNID